MIVSRLENSSRIESLHPLFKQLFDYVKTHDLLNAPLGRIELDGDNLFINNVNPECVPADNQEEYLADTGVIFTQGLQNTDHVRPLQDNNQQSRNHGEASNSKDQYQNHHHINILHLQPVEYHRIQFFDGAGIVCVTIPVLLLSNIKIQIFSNPVQVVIIIHLQFQTAHLVRRPTIQAAYLADISYHKQLVIITK